MISRTNTKKEAVLKDNFFLIKTIISLLKNDIYELILY